MSYYRKLELLNKHRVIYKRYPITDKPTETFEWGWFYEDGTYECYDLFRSKAKINTYKSLKWHLLVLWYLNPDFDASKFKHVASIICEKNNGFITFKVSKNLLESIIYEVSMYDLERPPKNRLRKVIFKDFSGLNINEKLSIVGRLIGRSKKIHQDDIYQCMLDINDSGKKITISKIAKILECSTRTIHRNMPEELKKEKILLNNEI